MYTVEAKSVSCRPSITYLPSELIEPEWIEIVGIPQLDTEQDELQEARKVAVELRKFYANVRITKSVGDRVREVVT